MRGNSLEGKWLDESGKGNDGAATGAHFETQFEFPFTSSRYEQMMHFYEWNGYFYTGGDGGKCKVWRSSDGLAWTNVADFTGAGDGGSYVFWFEEFNNELYVGTNSSLYKTANGTTWTKQLVFNAEFGEVEVRCLKAWGSYLYAGTSHGGKIYRSSDGENFTEVEDLPGQKRVYELYEWGSYLYAATMTKDGTTATDISFNDANPDTIVTAAGDFVADGFGAGITVNVSGSVSNDGNYTIDSVTSSTITLDAGDALTAEAAGATVTVQAKGKVFRSSDGTTWTEVCTFDMTQKRGRCFEVLGSYLYVGTQDPDSKVYRTIDGTTWTEQVDLGGTYVQTLRTFNSKIYAGITNAKLYESSDGATWTLIEDRYDTADEVRYLREFGGEFYASTGSPPPTVAGHIEKVKLHPWKGNNFYGNQVYNYVDMGNDSSLDITEDLTMAILFNPLAETTGGVGFYHVILSKAVNGYNTGYCLVYNRNSTPDEIRFGTDADNDMVIYQLPNPVTDTWYFIVGTIASGGNIELFVDNVSQGTDTAPASIPSNAANLLLMGGITNRNTNGKVSDVLIFN